MSTFHQDTPEFGSSKPGGSSSSNAASQCGECETMLADALDEMLAPEQQQRFDSHMLSCATCAEMLADAQRGAAWLELLRDPRPEPPALLVERILARTQATPRASLAPATQAILVAGTQYSALPPKPRANLYRFPASGKSMLRSLQHTLLQPRLAMTAAMAFFSVGLTLNLTGVQLNQLNPHELKPSNLRRSFYQANAHVIRYYDNLRVVYELESRVRELQRTGDDVPASETNAPKPEKQEKRPAPRPGSGSSRKQGQPPRVAPQTMAILEGSKNLSKKGELA